LPSRPRGFLFSGDNAGRTVPPLLHSDHLSGRPLPRRPNVMPVVIPDLRLPQRSGAWKWWVCGLLLLATMINYMDRLTLNLMAKPIMEDLGLDERDYGQLESAFAIAFAVGAIVAGWLADRWNVRWIYPAAVVVWSLAGFVTGLAEGFLALL